jgi:hypothetical protein
MTSRMDNKLQGGYNKTEFSFRSRENRNKTNTNHEVSSRVERTRENDGVSLPVQTKGRREMYISRRQTDIRTTKPWIIYYSIARRPAHNERF